MDLQEHKKPNFFIVGAPKAGTTALYHQLKQHPDIFLSELKEPNYFSYPYIQAQNLYYQTQNARNDEEYAALFKEVTHQKIIGEASVSYLFYKKVAPKIYAFNPDAVIVILLRNPVERAYSHYLMDYSFGYIDISFDEAIFKKTDHPFAHLYYQQYVELGYYKEQVERYLNLFGKQVNIYVLEQLKKDESRVLSDLQENLGVTVMDLSRLYTNHNSYKRARIPMVRKLYGNHRVKEFIKQMTGSRFNTAIKNLLFETEANKPPMSKAAREYLQELYRPHIEATAKLIGHDLTNWYH